MLAPECYDQPSGARCLPVVCRLLSTHAGIYFFPARKKEPREADINSPTCTNFHDFDRVGCEREERTAARNSSAFRTTLGNSRGSRAGTRLLLFYLYVETLRLYSLLFATGAAAILIFSLCLLCCHRRCGVFVLFLRRIKNTRRPLSVSSRNQSMNTSKRHPTNLVAPLVAVPEASPVVTDLLLRRTQNGVHNNCCRMF